MLTNIDIFFRVGLTSKSFSMVQQRWQKSQNIVGKYHRPKGNLGVVFKKIRVKWPKFSFKNTNVSLLNAMKRIRRQNLHKTIKMLDH